MKIKIKMMDMGEKRKEPTAIQSSPSKTETIYPTLSLNSDNIDGLDGLMAGHKCMLCFEAEVKTVGKGKNSWDSNTEGYNATFTLKKGSVQPKEKKKANDYTDASKNAKEEMEY